MSGCRERVIDLFVTKDSATYKDTFDDVFLGPVWSVEFCDADKVAVVNKNSVWIAFCKQMATIPEVLEEGDLVRVGHATTDGHTDYLTIVEKRPITGIRNAVTYGTQAAEGDGAAANGSIVGVTMQLINESGAGTPVTGGVFGPTPIVGTNLKQTGVISLVNDEWGLSQGIHPYAYRLNFNINVTKPVLNHEHGTTTSSTAKFDFNTGGVAATQKALEYRHNLRHSVFDTKITEAEKCYYPLYKVRKWLTNNGDIAVAMDHGVKSLHWMKLIGYSVFNKRQVGFQNAHEVFSDDWVALHVNEVQGGVISNNQFANGAFAVLHVGGTNDNMVGAIEYHAHDPAGLFTHYFDNHQSTIRNLNLKFLDRKGEAAHFGRIHLWFKVCVQHG